MGFDMDLEINRPIIITIMDIIPPIIISVIIKLLTMSFNEAREKSALTIPIFSVRTIGAHACKMSFLISINGSSDDVLACVLIQSFNVSL
jgi:hypothetical protein